MWQATSRCPAVPAQRTWFPGCPRTCTQCHMETPFLREPNETATLQEALWDARYLVATLSGNSGSYGASLIDLGRHGIIGHAANACGMPFVRRKIQGSCAGSGTPACPTRTSGAHQASLCPAGKPPPALSATWATPFTCRAGTSRCATARDAPAASSPVHLLAGHLQLLPGCRRI